MTKLILIALISTSCAGFKRTSPVTKPILTTPAPAPIPLTRTDKYFSCIKELNNNGLRQSLIGELCDKVYGSIND